VTELADEMRAETKGHNDLVTAEAFRLAADPTERYVPPEAEAPVPYLNFAPLQNALTTLEASAKAYDAALHEQGGALDAGSRARLNQILVRLEQTMTRAQGLPRRSWFKHQIYAPGFYTGYGVKTLPGVREAIEQRTWDEATQQIEIVAAVLEGVAAEIDRATGMLP
jgi:N-acetylated-alpha-linked acidic dipeptidase